MVLKEKGKIFDETGVSKAIKRIAHEIIEHNKSLEGLAIVGIRCRGAFLAERIQAQIKEISGKELPLGILDITLYRDDLTKIAEQPVVHKTEIKFKLEEKAIVLVDDVLFTGRTIRCALDELIDFGRPKTIQLAVLIDRGHRELPIRPDYVGKNVATALDEVVEVRMKEADNKDEVVLCQKKG